jgi:hypothetical protein
MSLEQHQQSVRKLLMDDAQTLIFMRGLLGSLPRELGIRDPSCSPDSADGKPPKAEPT